MTDPLANPRAVWRQHYDHRTLFGRWGRLIARVLRIEPSSVRMYSQLKRKFA